ncbi:MAG: leucyl aminopeptidase family protein, partial [Candidatus Puniceispirillales bacterium]
MSSRIIIEFTTKHDTPAYPIILLASGKNGSAVLDAAGQSLDKNLNGAITRAMAEADFKAGAGDDIVIRAAEGTVILVGQGAAADLGTATEHLGGHIASALGRSHLKHATLLVSDMPAEWLASVAHGAHLAGYHFSRYFTKGKAATPVISNLNIAVDDKDAATSAYQRYAGIAEGVFLARDLVSEPSNVLYPAEYADRCKALADAGIDVSILDETQMDELGMKLLLSVGQGSARESRMVVMRWNGGGTEAPLALIGKGVCFDTGGISIKPAGGMEDMKWDMGGSAAVVGAMRAIAGAGIKRNVVGLVGLVENMPDGKAIKPGDVVTSMSGQTVEIINTDAEGRLVLADVMTYAQKQFKPAAMVDLATLTGAILVSLGMVQSGLFSNQDDLAKAI